MIYVLTDMALRFFGYGVLLGLVLTILLRAFGRNVRDY